MLCCSACGVECASGWRDCVVQVLTFCSDCVVQFSVILYYYLLPSLNLRLLLLSIAIDTVDLDDCLVFPLIPSCVLLAFGKINLTGLDLMHSFTYQVHGFINLLPNISFLL